MAILDREVHGWVASLEAEMRLAAGTLAKYTATGLAHAAWCEARGRTSWCAVTREDVLASIAAGGVTRKTARGRFAAVRSLHRYLALSGVCADVTIGIRYPRAEERRREVMTAGEVVRVLEAIVGADPRSLRDRALLEFLYSTGCRISEATSLELSDMDLEAGRASVRGKGGRYRMLPIGSHAAAALGRWLTEGRLRLDGDPSEQHVFLSRLGRPLTSMGAWQLVARRTEAVLGRRVGPHQFRHACAVHCLEGGMDVRSLQLQLGHENLNTTATYLRLSDRWLKEAHRKHHPRS